MDHLAKPVSILKGIGKQKAEDLRKLGIYTVEDMLYHFPYRYEDRAHLKPINELMDNTVETVLGRVEQVEEIFTKTGKRMTRVHLSCKTGYIVAIWFNQQYIKNKLTYGCKIIVNGRVNSGYQKQIMVGDYEILGQEDEGTEFLRIMPVHRATEKVNAKFIRKLVEEALRCYVGEVVEFLPLNLMKKYHLPTLQGALGEIHFPKSWERLNLARYRLVMDEFLIMLLGLQMSSSLLQTTAGIAHKKSERLPNSFFQGLPFALTSAQKKVILEIKKDMERPEAMQRLLQGDVGCGKTMVAVYALLKAVEGGYQGAMMAPTEILAEQHYLSLIDQLAPLGLEVVLLKGSMSKKEKDEVGAAIASGEAQLVVGTHALIQKSVTFANLGVAVIDEQHRFGVKERLALENKGQAPDLLVMTATPIPRSLALTLYGDMALSIIDELPPGRQPIKTYHLGEKKRQKMYGFLAKEIKAGYQVYVVCPLVEESEKMDLENATALAERLGTEVFPQVQVGLLHGKMGTKEKAEVMANFRAGVLQILVSTTVIEVGVDVPNANVMVIENAERFGLAQLHQLRGRVGRGQSQAYCILLAEPKTEEGKRRMAIMTKSNDGFVIAEEDLALRGPGEVLGIRQHGLPDLKIANLISDIKLLEKSKELAKEITEEGLDLPKYQLLREKIEQVYRKKIALHVDL